MGGVGLHPGTRLGGRIGPTHYSSFNITGFGKAVRPFRSLAPPVLPYWPLNSFSSVSPTRFGFAFPFEAFITWPFRKLIATPLPAR